MHNSFDRVTGFHFTIAFAHSDPILSSVARGLVSSRRVVHSQRLQQTATPATALPLLPQRIVIAVEGVLNPLNRARDQIIHRRHRLSGEFRARHTRDEYLERDCE